MKPGLNAQVLTRKTHTECRPSIMEMNKLIHPSVGARFIAPTADLSAFDGYSAIPHNLVMINIEGKAAPKKFCCRMQHTCNISPLTQPLERDRYHVHGSVYLI